MDLASNHSNYAYGSMIDQKPSNVCAKNWRKVERNFEEILRSRSRFQNYEVLITKTVRIMLLYVMLMKLLITISVNAMVLMKCKCYDQLANSPHAS